MIIIRSNVHVPAICGARIIDFMLNCADSEYQKWWEGTHFQFHTIKRNPDNFGNLVYLDEFIGSRRLRTKAIVRDIIPDTMITWQAKMIFKLPVRIILEVSNDRNGTNISHVIKAGFLNMGRLLDPIFRLYLSKTFQSYMDEHVKIEFPLLGKMLLDSAVESQKK